MSRTLVCGDRQISAVLLDVTGVLYESGEGGGAVIKGSPEAVERYVSKIITTVHDLECLL